MFKVFLMPIDDCTSAQKQILVLRKPPFWCQKQSPIVIQFKTLLDYTIFSQAKAKSQSAQNASMKIFFFSFLASSINGLYFI